ncbi:MAG: peptide chain release factor N(5)-glutamine methyltransferase [Lachnospiraceae bacterium]|nr:peptide chain release factor N(5)-glutamine methyltransferase [Lachnospiraceae bacterium]
MNYSDILEKGENILADAGIDDALNDARLLIEEASGIDYSHLMISMSDEMPAEVEEKYRGYISLRKKRIPLQQIVGYTEFMGLRFHVNENVLCPRQDTEVLVETVLKDIESSNRKMAGALEPANNGALKVLDLCTGSGCIAISIARLSDAEVTASDISEKALEVAQQNAYDNHANVHFYQGDLYGALPQADKYDIIVSNPPYIRSDVIPTLMPEVKDHEPRIALDGSKDGLKFYREIIEKSSNYLKPYGRIYLEIGYDQADDVINIIRSCGYEDFHIIKDYSGNDRVVAATYYETNA